MSNIFNYFVSRTFWRHVSIALAIGIFFLLLTFSCIRVYTSHGRAYAVPDYTDMSIEEVVKNVEKKHFRYAISDSLYVAAKSPGAVLDQHPKPGVFVKKNRRIYFTINASGPESISMPNFVGITLREVKARIISFGLLVGELSYRFDISKNVVLEQRVDGNIIEPGASIPKGTTIDLVLGKGLGNERALVPNLLGLTLDEAKDKVATVMFNIGAVVPDGTVDEENDSLPARIFRQRPAGNGVHVPLGSTITVWTTIDSTKLPGYSVKEEEDEIIWPDLDDENEKDTSYTHNPS